MLVVHHADRADGLVAALASVLEAPQADPFAAEVVAVPTHGIERWLTQRLAGRLGTRAGRADGVCANVAFLTPRRLVDEAIAAATGTDADADPWRPARAMWPLLELVDAAAGEPWLQRLTAHLDRSAGDRSRRLSTVRHLAVLFDRYALYRPDMLRAWADGDDDVGAGAPLPAGARWQPELWRRLRDRVATPDPAHQLVDACARLAADPGLSDLPERLAVFGLTGLPARHLDVLHALAAHRDVHLLLLAPSRAAWEATARAAAARPPVATRADAQALALPASPLLASWGRDARELQLLLEPLPPEAIHAHHGAAGEPAALLEHLQAAVRADRGPASPRPRLDPADRSVQVHACHGRARQVEVLRDAILHALDADPSLEPRDVIVMCPDIETFAPLIQATFGAGEAELEDDALPAGEAAGVHPAGLRVRLADRSVRQTNPVLGVVARLLELARARVAASEVLDLADRAPVRRRFSFGEEELARIEDWVAASGTRWGLDPEHREPFRMQRVGEGTWRAGLDRVLLGAAVAERPAGTYAGVLPLDDVDSSAIDLAGRLAELLDRLAAALGAFAAPMPVAGWAAAISDAADALTATSPRDAWQRSELQRLLADVVDEATTDGVPSPAPLDVDDVAALVGDRLAGRPTRANFRTGHLTVCTLQPMRSVPHRVVCLLGLDDTIFPRQSPHDGDDLLLIQPCVGDRDARSEDRQILLDALMAAGDRLVVTYTGRSEHTNARRAPAVPVGELLDVIDRTADAPDGGRARDAVVIEHPLQPFDTANFERGALVGDCTWSFDAVTLQGARALVADRRPRAPFLAGPLPAAPVPADGDAAVIELEDLLAFVAHPVRAFLAQRLGVGSRARLQEPGDALPIELDGLARWGIGDRLLAARRAGVPMAEAVAAERARGAVPPGEIGVALLRGIVPEVDAILAAAASVIGDPGELRTRDLRIALAGGRALAGTVAGVGEGVLPVVTFSRVDARRRLEAWVRLLALTAAFPDEPLTAATVGRARRSAADRGARVTIALIRALGPAPEARRADALAQLEILTDVYARGMREPLPLFRETSAAYAAGGPDADRRAHAAWETEFRPLKEDRDPEHQLVFGGDRAFDDVLAEPPRDDERGDGWFDDEPSRFGRYAKRLWWGPLRHEELADP
jgi:exodeoxyribonuclease V gamma subunit